MIDIIKIIENVYWATRRIFLKVTLFNNLMFEEDLKTFIGLRDDTYIAGIRPASNPVVTAKMKYAK